MKFQMTSGNKNLVYKKIQGGKKHDITLRLSNKHPWEVAVLTLHKWGRPEEALPFRVETELGSQEWIYYDNGCEIHAEDGPCSYTSVRAQFCKTYFGEPLQWSMQVQDRHGYTNVAIVVVKHKRKNADGTYRNRNQCARFTPFLPSQRNVKKL